MIKKNNKSKITLPMPTDSLAFFEKIKEVSNNYWTTIRLHPGTYGFQIQKDTLWRDGLNDNDLIAFENTMGFEFPPALRNFYKTMNGLNKDGINIYGDDGSDFSYHPVYYSFPDHVDIIKDLIAWIYEANKITLDQIMENEISRIFPICGHRFMLIDEPGNPILSMYGDDIVPYADNISKLIAREEIGRIIENKSDFKNNTSDFSIKFWLDLDR